MNILLYPNKHLESVAEEVTTSEYRGRLFQERCNELIDTMRKHNGAGLAAPQVGWMKRVIAVGDRVYVNPTITERSIQWIDDREGCLSFPGASIVVHAPSYVTVVWGVSGNIESDVFVTKQARAICHEIDHLNGKTILDRLSKEKKRDFLKQYAKRMR
jgi:peptide deformylase